LIFKNPALPGFFIRSFFESYLLVVQQIQKKEIHRKRDSKRYKKKADHKRKKYLEKQYLTKKIRETRLVRHLKGVDKML